MSAFDILSEHERYMGEHAPEPWEQDLPSDLREKVPLISIIVPVHNGLDFTRDCVESLYSNTPEVFELVVVDNASDDGTSRYLDTLEGITIRNETNVGFPKAVNKGLTRARGKFVCLLNNDTKVLPGWLQPLLEDAAMDDVGSVGPLQLDGDGLVWHFGTVFYPDEHVYKRRPRQLYIGYPPEYVAPLTRREYPSMNFACCVSRKEIYDEVGELDEGLAFPGYFEDVDWTLRVRKLGYRNLFEPRSVIIHYGSKGVPTPETKRKAEQARTRNIKRLEERFQDAPPVLFQVRDYDFDLSSDDVALVSVSENGSPVDVTPLLRRNHLKLEREKEMLEAARKSRGVEEERPLVSVLIPTFNNAKILTELTLPSVLNQTYENIEVVIVGDSCEDDTAERIARFNDERIRFFNLQERGQYPEDPMGRWRVAGAVPRNKCIEMARGVWLAPLDDDDEFSPDHVEVLVNEALRCGYEMIYGKVLMEMSPGWFEELGEFPLWHGKISHMAALYRSDLGFFQYDIECWKLEEPLDWNMWRRMKECSVKIGFLDHVVGTHYLGRTAWSFEKKGGLPRRKMDALLVWPAVVDFSDLDMTWIPHGVTQLATCANKSGHEVSILDGRTLGINGIKAAILNTNAKYVGFSILSAYAGYAKELITFTRRMRPEVKIIIGGIHPTVASGDFDTFDYLIKGEGEITFPKILSGEIEPGIIVGERPDLATLPSIDRSLISIKEKPLPGLEEPFATVIIGRGCVYRCNFCYPAERLLFGKKVRFRPVDNAVEELEEVKSFMVHDDCFTAKRDYVEEFCARIKDKSWWCQGRADNVVDNIEMVKKMVDAGLKGMILGFESGDDRVLESLDKQTTVEQNLKAAEILKGFNVTVWANIILGTPFEPPSAVINTVTMCQQMKPDITSLCVFTPHPGSALYDFCKDNNLMPEHDYEYFNRGKFEQKIFNQDMQFLEWAANQILGTK